jgi:hypothetical protein
VLWRLHRIMVALRSDARGGRDCDLGLGVICDAIEGLMTGDSAELDRRLAASTWSGAWRSGGTPRGDPVVDARVAVGFAEALLLGCRAAIGSSPSEVAEFAHSMEYIPAELCAGDVSVLDGLDDAGESRLVQVVGRELRIRHLP